ncbi:MAG: hypothetical protein NVS1B2_16190 [Vulcanimicrobiaceae bacterium]
MDPLYYTYEASEHCIECALARFGRDPNGFVPASAEDNDGNPVGAAFDFEDAERDLSCGTCSTVIYARDVNDYDDDDDERELYPMTKRELATVLAALRLWERERATDDGIPDDIFEIAADAGTPLEIQEVDALCEALNTTPQGFPIFDGRA